MKLSRAQLAILRRLGEGDTLTLMKGLHPWHFWCLARDVRTPRWDSVQKLIDAGLIEATEEDWRTADYAITQEGRDYLAGLEE